MEADVSGQSRFAIFLSRTSLVINISDLFDGVRLPQINVTNDVLMLVP